MSRRIPELQPWERRFLTLLKKAKREVEKERKKEGKEVKPSSALSPPV